MKTEKYFIQKLETILKRGWFDWYGTVGDKIVSSDFQGFDSEEIAMSICLGIPKFNGDEYRVIKRTTISIDEQCAHFVY
jgi:hypothetical protein